MAYDVRMPLRDCSQMSLRAPRIIRSRPDKVKVIIGKLEIEVEVVLKLQKPA